MNKIRFTQRVLVLTFTSLLSFSAYAYRPTYTYYATVQAGLSTSSTGGGLVYVAEEATDYTTVQSSDWRPNASENGSEGGNSSNTENDNVDVYLYAKANRGYLFDGWADSNTGTPGNKGELVNGVYRSKREFQVGNNSWYPIVGYYNREKKYTMYAFFTPIEYEITYNANGGSVSPTTPQKYTIRSTGTLRTPTRTGYTFNGWKVTAVDESDGGWTVNNNAPSALNKNIGNVSLEAQWTPIEYTITYNADGGTLSSAGDQTYNIESTSTVKTATKTDYTLKGWEVTATGGNWPAVGSTVSDGASLTGKYGNVALKALWGPSKADITITISGLAEGETIMLKIKKDDVILYTVPITGKASGSSSVTIKNLPTGSGYSVSPVQGWNFAYDQVNFVDTFGLSPHCSLPPF